MQSPKHPAHLCCTMDPTIQLGPRHPCLHRPLGRTLMRDRLLNRLGYIVVAVPYSEWDAWRPDAELAEYLLAKIGAAVARQRCALPKDTSALEALAPKVSYWLF